MSSAVSALSGAAYAGYVQVVEAGLNGMITLRGDLSDAAFTKAFKAAIGLDVPDTRGISFKGKKGVAWMSPDELMVFVAYEDATKTVAALSEALGEQHHLVVDVSDARAMFTLSGSSVREVVAKLCPVDMDPEQFGPGKIRRTRMAQIPAAIWMPKEGEINVICFRSVAQYAFDLLKDAATPGSEVGLFS
ncbi:MAG: sarcosine oxidase subunit gamma family protein [Pseudomonadota bacterium]